MEKRVTERLGILKKEDFVRRLWQKDGTLWDSPPRAEVNNRLGWLTVTEPMEREMASLGKFAAACDRSGFRHAVVLGMGGSSLCPELIRQTFRANEDGLRLHVLDSTDPEQIRILEESFDERKTLFLVSSKSGTTLEIDALSSYFFNKVRDPSHFIAITDPGSPLDLHATKAGFRSVFRNPPDIGGRYSALSFFGLVPAALMGVNLPRLLRNARSAFARCGILVPPEKNPGVWLGAFLAEAQLAGKNKLTLVIDPPLTSLGMWIDQLVAESLGKEGKGLLPVDLEPLLEPECYDHDRIFVHVAFRETEQTDSSAHVRSALRNLELRGHPTVQLTLRDTYAVGGEFVRWEIAVATAGHILGINPFDQPDVEDSKERTRKFLGTPKATSGGPFAWDRGLVPPTPLSLDTIIREHFNRIRGGDYVAFLLFLPQTRSLEVRFSRMRSIIQRATGCATTLNFGPRYLHASGQLHKGGPDSGLFLMISRKVSGKNDIPLSGQTLTFGALEHAQATGDFDALAERGRRIIHVELQEEFLSDLSHLERAIASALDA